MNLPAIRRGERADAARCLKKWYWAWRRGLVPKAKQFGALDLGTWMHAALAAWYGKGRKRNGSLKAWFYTFAMNAITNAHENNVPQHEIEKAYELLSLGEAMAEAYELRYGKDSEVNVITAEIPLEFTFTNPDTNKVIAVHKFKPDLVYQVGNALWLMEHKTAASIRTEHLVIDNQARPYGAMAERALRKLRMIRSGVEFKGIMYNFLRKALPDLREHNAKGQALNKDGSVSKRQPPAFFLRHPVVMSRKAKMITLGRVAHDAAYLTSLTQRLREGTLPASELPKTPHYTCPKTCQFFAMCVAEEEGADISFMERSMFIRRDPYIYEEETTDEPVGFDLG